MELAYLTVCLSDSQLLICAFNMSLCTDISRFLSDIACKRYAHQLHNKLLG